MARLIILAIGVASLFLSCFGKFREEVVDVELKRPSAIPIAELPAKQGPQRDPFESYLKITANLTSDQDFASLLREIDPRTLRLVGVVSGINGPQALVEDPLGHGFTLKEKMPVGRREGRVESIRGSEVVISEEAKDDQGNAERRYFSMHLGAQ